MRRHRYMIVEHSVSPDSRKFEDLILPIHTMLGTYHWAKLDDGHVYVTGHYEISMHDRLARHPKVSVMPHASSNKRLHMHLSERTTHWNALSKKLSLDSSASMSDAIEAAESVFGPVFGEPQ